MLYTERPGRIGIYVPTAQTQQTLRELPSDFFYDGFQAGMLGIAVDPEFGANRYVYTFMTSRTEASAAVPREIKNAGD